MSNRQPSNDFSPNTRPTIRVGDRRSLRRPQTTQGGFDALAGTSFQIVASEEHKGEGETSKQYTLVREDRSGQLADAKDPNNVLVLSHWRMNHHTREAKQTTG